MSKEDDTLGKDANNFCGNLRNKIRGCKKLDKKEECTEGCADYEKDERHCEGKKIKFYLDKVVPEWQNMTSVRLYKHIQKMLENAENTRKFEIELIWKRVIYLIPLLVISFTAFGFGFIYFQNSIEEPVSFSNLTSKGAMLLTLLSLLNALLSVLLARINLEGHKWQENWEYHVDYLQAILGLTLMRICLRIRESRFTIARSNALIGRVISVAWVVLAVFSYFPLVLNITFASPYEYALAIPAAYIGYVLLFEYYAFLKEILSKSSKKIKKTEVSYFRSLKDLQLDKLDDGQDGTENFWDKMKKCLCFACDRGEK